MYECAVFTVKQCVDILRQAKKPLILLGSQATLPPTPADSLRRALEVLLLLHKYILTALGCLQVKLTLADPRCKVWQLAESNHLFDFGSHDCISRENSKYPPKYEDG